MTVILLFYSLVILSTLSVASFSFDYYNPVLSVFCIKMEQRIYFVAFLLWDTRMNKMWIRDRNGRDFWCFQGV